MSKSGVGSSAIAPPAGSGLAAGLGEAFSLDLNTGQGTYSVPFDLPLGPGERSPRIKLQYMHGAGQGAFGFGWRLPLRTIERRLDFGTPGNEASASPSPAVAERFRDGGVELVPIPGGGYRAARETSFAHYERSGGGWIITETNGDRHELGLTPQGRETDPDDPNRIQTWLLERTIDNDGNATDYRWMHDRGTSYLVEVHYSVFRLVLGYEARPDVRRNGRAGWLRLLGRRCASVQLWRDDTAPALNLRSWQLSYEEDPRNGSSLLSSVTFVAHGEAVDGSDDVVRPPITFRYATPSPTPSITWIESDAGNEPPPLTDPDVALVTLDDLPLPGILQVVSGQHVYWPNRGDGRWGAPRPILDAPYVAGLDSRGLHLLDLEGNGTADLYTGLGSAPLHGYWRNDGGAGWGGFVAWPRRSAEPPWVTGRVRLADLDGDGRIDALYGSGHALMAWESHGAEGWSGPLAAARQTVPEVDLADPTVFLTDMTGDGAPDIVRVRSGRVEYWPNLGHGRFGEPIVMVNSPRLRELAQHPDQIVLIDTDGTGCADLVRVSIDGIEVAINKGGASFSDLERTALVPAPLPGTLRAVGMLGTPASGLLWNSGRSRGTGYVYAQFASTTAPYCLQGIDNGLGLGSEIEYGTAVDEALRDRAEGQPWSSHLPFPLTVVTGMLEIDQTTGQRTEVRLRYHEGHFDADRRQFEGFGRVEKIEIGDESRATSSTVHWFLAREQQEPGRGPEHANLNGLLARMERFELDGSVLEPLPVLVEESEYEVSLLQAAGDHPPRAFTFLRSTRRTHRMRSDDARIEEREYDYDANGNVVTERFRAFGTRQGVGVPEVVTTTNVTYATHPTGRVRNAVARITRRDGSGGIFEEHRRHYDGPDFVGLPMGQVQRGHVTREERLVLDRATFDAHYSALEPDLDLATLGYVPGLDGDGTAAVFMQHQRKAYASRGSVRAEMDPMGNVVSYVHDAAELVQRERHEPLGVTRIEHDPRSQRPTRIASPDGNVVEMRYDGQGRLLAVALGGDTLADPTRRYSYDDTSIPASQEVSYRIANGTRLQTVTYFDGRAKVIQKRVERAPGEVITSGVLVRNPWGQTAIEYEPTIETTLAFAIPDLTDRPTRSFRYDVEGRPLRTVDYGGGVSTARYLPFDIEQRDANDNDDSPENLARGLFDTPRREQTDAVGRRILIEESLGGGATRQTRFTTGIAGELLTIEDALGEVARYRYDRRGNRLEVVHRDAGTRQLWYDAAGRAVRTLDARGTAIEASYDAQGRLLALTADGSIVEQYTYDDLATGGLGRLREVVYPGGSQRFEYDLRGQVTRHEHAFDGHAEPWALAFEYDGMGKQTAVIHPDGTRVTQHNDLNGMVRQIDGIIDEVLYDARGLPISVRYANGVHTTLAYEPGPGKVRHQHTVGASGQVLQDARYGYDRLQMVLTVDDQAPGGVRNVRYDYDPLQQLTRARGQAPGGNFDSSYGYVNDRSLAQIGEIDTTLRFDDAAHPDHVTEIRRGSQAPFNPTYDANGNLGALPGRTLEYDHKNQVVRVTRDDGTVIDYAYDHRGQRIRKRVTTMGVSTETLMIGAHAEVRNGQLVRFVLLGKARVALHWAGSTLWIHTDPLGSASVFSDASGVGVSRISYQAFGNVRGTTGTPATQTFGGHEFDADAGLYFMGRRCYAPDLGRFITPDPLYLLRPETADGDPAPLSLYTYVGNDPTNRIDPNGLSFWSVFGAIVGVIVGVVLAVVVIAAFVVGVGWGLLALAGAIGLLTAGYMGARELAGTDGGEFLRGMLIGINAGANFVLATLVFGLMFGWVAGLVIGITLGVINFLAAFDTIAHSEVYQGILGWTNWFMPMSWLVIGLGATLWVLNVLGFLFTFGQVDALKIDGMRVDWKTGTIFTKGGWISNLNAWDTAFNMGNFAFVDTNFSDPNWAMEHEAGHNLNLAAYGSIFHFIGFIDEMISGASAFSEQLAEGNDPSATGPTLPQWT